MQLIKSIPPALLNSILAGLGYGAWAIYANYEHGMDAWLMAGILQGLLSFFITLGLTIIATRLYHFFGRGVKGVTLSWAVNVMLLATIPYSIHFSAGTPNILQTILPGLTIGSCYLILYLLSLHRKS